MKQYNIEPLHQPSMESCRLRIDNLTKPIYSLAMLETMAERMAGILAVEKPNHLHYGVLVVGADHLVDGPQNDTHGAESFASIERFNIGCTATQGAAAKLEAPVYVVNVGLERSTDKLNNIDTKTVRFGSHFFGVEAAMSDAEFEAAFTIGMEYAERLHADGIQVVALGNVGEHAYLDALVVTATITGAPYESLLTDTDCGPTIEQKAAHIHSFVDKYKVAVDWSALTQEGRYEAVKHLITVAGGLDIAMLVGFVLRAAELRMAIVFDNAVTGAAVLAAVTMEPQVKDYVFPSAVYDEPIHREQCQFLGVKPYLHYDLHIDEAVGSTMGLSVIDASMHMLNDMKTFVEAEVKAAEDGAGKGRQEDIE